MHSIAYRILKTPLLPLAILCLLALPAFAFEENESCTSMLPDKNTRLKPGNYFKEPYVYTVMAVVLQADQEVMISTSDKISVGAGTQANLTLTQALERLKSEKKKDFLRIVVFENEESMKQVDEIIEKAGYKRVVVMGCSAFYTKVLKDIVKEEPVKTSIDTSEPARLVPGYYTFSERLREKGPFVMEPTYDTAKWTQVCRTAERADKWLVIKGPDSIQIDRNGKDQCTVSEAIDLLKKEEKKDFLTIAILKDYLLDVNVWTQAHEIMNRSGYKRVLLLGYSDWAMIVFEDERRL